MVFTRRDAALMLTAIIVSAAIVYGLGLLVYHGPAAGTTSIAATTVEAGPTTATNVSQAGAPSFTTVVASGEHVAWGVVSAEARKELHGVELAPGYAGPLPLRGENIVLVGAVTATLEARSACVSCSAGGVETVVPGVLEPDDFTVYGDKVYVAKGHEVLVYRVKDGSLSLLYRIDVENALNKSVGITLRLGKARVEFNASIAVNKALVVPGPGDVYVIIASCTIRAGVASTPITVILVVNGTRVKALHALGGFLYDARLAWPVLWVATGSYVRPYTLMGVVPDSAVLRLGRGYYTTIAAINVTSGNASVVAVEGGYPALMLTYPDQVTYLLVSGLLVRRLSVAERPGVERLVSKPTVIVAKVSLRGGVLRVEHTAVLEGMPTREAFAAARGSDGVLRVVLQEPSGGFHLYNLDADTLRKLGDIVVERPAERVRAVRVLDGYVYIVTYRMRDPLFAIDDRDPVKPRILGFIKGPGFEDYLRPLNRTVMLGVGYDDKHRLRVSLYRVTDGNVTLVDRLTLAEYRFSLAVSTLTGYRDIAVCNNTIFIPAVAVEKGRWSNEIVAVKLEPRLEKLASIPGVDEGCADGYLVTYDGARLRLYKLPELRLVAVEKLG